MALKELPEFELKKQDGNIFNSKELKGKACVIYFYPKNFTAGCTAQACGFRDHFQDFSDAGIRVVGISKDSESSHKRFSNKYDIPFTLLSDSKGKVTRMFGVQSKMFGLIPGRETFVFNTQGELVSQFDGLAPGPHIKKALKLINSL